MANALLLEPVRADTITCDSAMPGTSASFVDRDEMGLVWRTEPGAGLRTIIIDFGSDVAIDTIMAIGIAEASPTWTWTVALSAQAQGGFSGAYWQGAAEPLLAGSEMPVTGLGKGLWRAPSGAPAVARYLRIVFGGLGGAAFEVSRILAGRAVHLDRNFRFGAALGVRPLGTLDFSARGVILRRRGKKLRGLGLSFPSIRRDEVEAKVQPLLQRVGNDEALAIVLDPTPDPQRQNRLYYGFLAGDLGSTWARANGFQADFNLIAID